VHVCVLVNIHIASYLNYVYHSQASYSSVLLAHSRLGDAARAQHWFDRMVSCGIPPDAIAFNTLLAAHAASPSDAVAVLQRMAAAGVAASPTSHAIVIQV